MSEIQKLTRLYSLIAKMHSKVIIFESMKASNAQQEFLVEEPHFTERDFLDKAKEMDSLASEFTSLGVE